VSLYEDDEVAGPAPQRTPDRAAAALRYARAGTGGIGALIAGRRRLIGAFAALVLIVVGVWWFALRDTGPKYEPGAFNVHAWAPDWELDNSAPTFDDRANLFHQISPFWYRATGVTTVELAESVNTDEKREATEDFVDDVRSRGVPLVPSITDGTTSGAMAAILADPAERAAHIDALAAFAADNDFDGLDINSEKFAFSDDRDTWATTRPGWVAFIVELGARLHADGRVLTVSVPPVYDTGRTDDSGWWVYDYAGIAPHVDAIRVMVYDYSVNEPGPIAPLSYVEDSIDGAIEAAGGPEKIVLGIPLYGRNWVTSVEGQCPDDADGEVIAQPMTRITEILSTRTITTPPTFDEETGEVTFAYEIEFSSGEESCTQTREVHYLGDEGVRQRLQISIDRGLLGVALFAFGYETEVVWNDITAINATLATTIPEEASTGAPATAAPVTTPAPVVTTQAPATTLAPTSSAAPATAAPTTAGPTTT
jgi:spore germination protein YaaH